MKREIIKFINLLVLFSLLYCVAIVPNSTVAASGETEDLGNAITDKSNWVTTGANISFENDKATISSDLVGIASVQVWKPIWGQAD